MSTNATAAPFGVPSTNTGTSTSDLLAGLDLVEVNVLDDALHRVALNILDDGHLGLVAVLDGEQSVGVTQGQGGLLHRQLHEDRIPPPAYTVAGMRFATRMRRAAPCRTRYGQRLQE